MEKIKKIIFNELFSFIMIFFILGLIVGTWLGVSLYKSKIEEGIKIGGMLFNGNVYQIIEKKQ